MSRSKSRYRNYRPHMRDSYLRDILQSSRQLDWTSEDLIEFLLTIQYTDDLDRIRNTMTAFAAVYKRNEEND